MAEDLCARCGRSICGEQECRISVTREQLYAEGYRDDPSRGSTLDDIVEAIEKDQPLRWWRYVETIYGFMQTAEPMKESSQ